MLISFFLGEKRNHDYERQENEKRKIVARIILTEGFSPG